MLPSDEIAFDSDVYLLLPRTAEACKAARPSVLVVEAQPQPANPDAEQASRPLSSPQFSPPVIEVETLAESGTRAKNRTLRIYGDIPTEVWQRLGRTLIPKLKSGADLHVGLDVSVSLDADGANGLRREIQQILEDLKLEGKVTVEWK